MWLYTAEDFQHALAVLPATDAPCITALALSADGQLLAAAGGEPEARLAVWQWRQVWTADAI